MSRATTQRPRLDNEGDFVTDAVHIVERYTFMHVHTFLYQATIENPSVRTRPWKIVALAGNVYCFSAAVTNESSPQKLTDFWDGLPRPLTTEDIIEISAEFRGFEKSENLLAVLADDLVNPDPMVACITYRYQPVAGLKGQPKSESDYEFVIFGGGRPDNTVGYDLRRWIPLDLFPALRDAEADSVTSLLCVAAWGTNSR